MTEIVDIVVFVEDVLKIELLPHQKKLLQQMKAGEIETFVRIETRKKGFVKFEKFMEEFR